jgi:hypothetical protein
MGGKSRKTGGISKKLIDRIKSGAAKTGSAAAPKKPKTTNTPTLL